MKRAADKGGESEGGGDRPPRRADAPNHITWCAATRARRVDALLKHIRAARSALGRPRQLALARAGRSPPAAASAHSRSALCPQGRGQPRGERAHQGGSQPAQD
jgi:hypothetical protein